MIEPGFPTLLAYPALSFALAALTIGLAALALYRGGRARSPSSWRRLNLLSEVLLTVGLIGLAVFAGRVAMSSNQVLLEQRVHAAQAMVDEGLRAVASAQCTAARNEPPIQRGAVPSSANLTPFNPGVAANELCAIARARPAAGASIVEWQMAARALHDFGARYPGCVDNVFSRNNDCESIVGAASRLAATVDELASSMRVARFEGSNMAEVHGERDWGFALAAAFLAAAGMAIRLARAAADLYGAGK
ncbi:MAG: hypothetical protein JWP59_4501 [Massilia sp.]|jgi:hypothetical protein|nr:hypothetical protein [Massilia sp.]